MSNKQLIVAYIFSVDCDYCKVFFKDGYFLPRRSFGEDTVIEMNKLSFIDELQYVFTLVFICWAK